MPLHLDPGKAAELRVEPRAGDLAYDEVFADPVSGKVLGTRGYGDAKFTRANIIPLIYIFHYSLKLPLVWGMVLMGGVACIWAIDCFVGFALTIPRGGWRKWGMAWRVKTSAGNYRLNLDLHRAGGLWLWLLLFMMAVSGISLTLNEQVFRPLLGSIVKLSPSPLEVAASRPAAKPGVATISFDEAIARARSSVVGGGWTFTPRLIFHVSAYGAYGVGFSRAGEDGENGLGNSYIYVDDRTGAVVAREIMGEGTPGDVFAQAQFALHSGRIIGLPGRILIALLGLCIAGLSVTGVYIWARKSHWFTRTRRKAVVREAIGGPVTE
jgi:uncharacterized iron-regulated membrane protein